MITHNENIFPLERLHSLHCQAALHEQMIGMSLLHIYIFERSFTSPWDKLSCQKLIWPPDLKHLTGLCKIEPSRWHFPHQTWETTAHSRGIRRRFLCGCLILSHVLIIAGFLRNINTCLFPGQKIKWLIDVLTLCYLHTDAWMRVGQPRHVCSCSPRAAC